MVFKSLKSLQRSTARFFSQFPHEYRRTHKAKTKVIEKYEALPPWCQVTPKDPFDYPLKTRDEVREYQRLNPPNFDVECTFGYVLGTTENNEYRGRSVRLTVNIDSMRLTEKQKARLIFLLGDRYKPKENVVKINVHSYENPEHNMVRGLEILKELYLETIRAP